MSEIELSALEMRALEAALHGDVSDPVELMRSAGVDVTTFFEFGDWRGMDFRKSNLEGVSFRGSDLRGAKFTFDQFHEVAKSAPLHHSEPPSEMTSKKRAVVDFTVPWTADLAASDPEGTSYAFGDCVVFEQADFGMSYSEDEISISIDDSIHCETKELGDIIEKYAPDQIGDNLPHYFINRIRRGTSDFSGVELELGVSWYRDVRALHAALLDNPYQATSKTQSAPSLIDHLINSKPLEFGAGGLPAQLSVNCVIVLNPPDEEPCLILARRGSEHQVGYYPRAWSISFQETLSAPNASQEMHDESITDGALRGLSEEFLGGAIEGIEVGVLCFLIEMQIMNQSSIAFAKVPLDFEQFCLRRRHMASDAAENNLIVRVPFNADVLIELLGSNSFPGASEKVPMKTDPTNSESLDAGEVWHPSSRLAIYMALRRFFPSEAKSWLLQRLDQN